MSIFKAVDAEAATKAKEVLAPFRRDKTHDIGIPGLRSPIPLEIELTTQRADRLEQAIAEAIHEAANQPDAGNPTVSIAKS